MTGSGDIRLIADGGGVGAMDDRRTPRLFQIVSGSSGCYTANEVYLKEATGDRPATGVYEVTASQKVLWEVNRVTTVPAGKVVEATPNPAGTGFYFSYPALADRSLIDLCVIKSGGNVTDIRVTWRNPDGSTECETVPTCSEAGCDGLWLCTEGGVVGYTPGDAYPGDYISGPYPTEAEATAACTGGSGVGTACCPDDLIPQTLTFTVTSGGCNGLSFTLTYQTDSEPPSWTGDDGTTPTPHEADLWCEGGTWHVSFYVALTATWGVSGFPAVICGPAFQVSGTLTRTSGVADATCSDTFTFTITE